MKQYVKYLIQINLKLSSLLKTLMLMLKKKNDPIETGYMKLDLF